MNLWEGLLFAIAALVAVRVLVGMMRRREESIVQEVQAQVDAHIEREKEAKKKKRAVSR
ncbi:hypothetical protein [Botrimarina mediterranea]|uniref:Uncharacterized protein n=1 Tax=Botrimarina mediterranea TaxID=2528022 RepID=A0A518KE43_9BACT|nr:hypothetical protein [Botrimarina mediterranea]QDV76057.1 hypothetical protein Spa11_42810 [Botrimarina mediterranea]